jgi:elongation factor Ts
MYQVSSADISKLRKITGAGMMDCKNGLVEAEGDFDKAIEVIRKKGQAVANKRADRVAGEGVVLAKVCEDQKTGVMVAINCETDFVAKNDNFVAFVQSVIDAALTDNPENIDALKKIKVNNTSVEDLIMDRVAAIGEKIELSYFEKIVAEKVVAYIHPGNKLASLVGFNKPDANIQVYKDIAMQVAAMNPIAVDIKDIPQNIIDKEIEIGKEQSRLEGKPENMLEKIALGKLNKFYKESTLLNQDYIKDNKKTIKHYLGEIDKDLTVTQFKRCSLNI